MGGGGIKLASAKKNQQLDRKDLILVHAVQLKPMIKVQISGRMASIGISDVVTASVYSEKNPYEEVDDDDQNDNNYYYE